MDKSTILAMTAGPELDVLVAEKVMQWQPVWIRCTEGSRARQRPACFIGGHFATKEQAEAAAERHYTEAVLHWSKTPGTTDGTNEFNFRPSGNISDAWQVVDRLQDLEYWLRTISGRNGKWEKGATVEVGKLPDLNGNPSRMIAQVNGSNIPLMICMMALVAIFEQ